MDVVRLKVKEIAEQKGVDNPFALSQSTGLGYAVCHKLWSGNQTMIALDTINRLCKTLRVKPGQLFEYDPDPEE